MHKESTTALASKYTLKTYPHEYTITHICMLVVDSRLLFFLGKLFEMGFGCRQSVVGFPLLSVGRHFLSFASIVSDCCVTVVECIG
jgi:hypothetical protein